MNKTLYLRDEEVPIWDRARELSGDKLSPVVVKALKRFISEIEAQTRGYERIVVEFNDSTDHHLPKAKAFFGRWIIDRKKPLEVWPQGASWGGTFSVAETPKGNVVVYWFRYDGDSSWGHQFLICSSFEEAAANGDINYAIREAARRRGVAVEELDI